MMERLYEKHVSKSESSADVKIKYIYIYIKIKTHLTIQEKIITILRFATKMGSRNTSHETYDKTLGDFNAQFGSVQ